MSTLTRRASIAVTVLLALIAVAVALVWGSDSVFGQEAGCQLVPALAVGAVDPDGNEIDEVAVGDVVTYSNLVYLHWPQPVRDHPGQSGLYLKLSRIQRI